MGVRAREKSRESCCAGRTGVVPVIFLCEAVPLRGPVRDARSTACPAIRTLVAGTASGMLAGTSVRGFDAGKVAPARASEWPDSRLPNADGSGRAATSGSGCGCPLAWLAKPPSLAPATAFPAGLSPASTSSAPVAAFRLTSAGRSLGSLVWMAGVAEETGKTAVVCAGNSGGFCAPPAAEVNLAFSSRSARRTLWSASAGRAIAIGLVTTAGAGFSKRRGATGATGSSDAEA